LVQARQQSESDGRAHQRRARRRTVTGSGDRQTERQQRQGDPVRQQTGFKIDRRKRQWRQQQNREQCAIDAKAEAPDRKPAGKAAQRFQRRIAPGDL